MPPDHQFHYLPEGPEERLWGVKLRDVGSGMIGPGEAYPPRHHPSDYLYSWENGRILEEHQIVLISEGRGEFESQNGGRHRFTAPCIFVLFPNEWHRYRSNPETGWTEHWIGFAGDYAESILRGIVKIENPIIKLHDAPREMERLIQELLDNVSGNSTKQSIEPIISALRIIGCLHKIQIERQSQRNPDQKKIAEARMIILARFNEKLDWDALAARLGMSTATFRRRFVEGTGLPPFQYQTRIRLNRAKTMLSSGKRVSEVSDFLGYSSPYHFSNLFREREGLSPKAYAKKYQTRVDKGSQDLEGC